MAGHANNISRVYVLKWWRCMGEHWEDCLWSRHYFAFKVCWVKIRRCSMCALCAGWKSRAWDVSIRWLGLTIRRWSIAIWKLQSWPGRSIPCSIGNHYLWTFSQYVENLIGYRTYPEVLDPEISEGCQCLRPSFCAPLHLGGRHRGTRWRNGVMPASMHCAYPSQLCWHVTSVLDIQLRYALRTLFASSIKPLFGFPVQFVYVV